MRSKSLLAAAIALSAAAVLPACSAPAFKGKNAAFCTEVKKALDKLDDLGDPDVSRKPADVVKRFKDAATAIDTANRDEKRPEAVKAALQTLTTAIDDVAKKVSDANGDLTKVDVSNLKNADLEAASSSVIAFLTDTGKDGCKGKITPLTPVTTSTTAG